MFMFQNKIFGFGVVLNIFKWTMLCKKFDINWKHFTVYTERNGWNTKSKSPIQLSTGNVFKANDDVRFAIKCQKSILNK